MENTSRLPLFVGTLALCLSSSLARAETFDGLAEGAISVETPTQLSALFWNDDPGCDEAGDAVAQLQCRALQKARREHRTDTLYRVRGDAASLKLSKYDERKKSVVVDVRACVACVTPAVGAQHFVIGNKGAARWSGGALQGPPVVSKAQIFGNAEEAQTWIAETAPRMITEFLIRVPARANVWKKSDPNAYRVTVVGYRVYDSCDGAIFASSPESEPGPADAATCPQREEPPVATPETTEPPVDTAPKIPERLAPAAIARAMAPVRAKAEACFDEFGVAGDAKFHITIGGDGSIVNLVQKGDFVDTPTGKCVSKAIDGIVFPRSRKRATKIVYPIVLR